MNTIRNLPAKVTQEASRDPLLISEISLCSLVNSSCRDNKEIMEKGPCIQQYANEVVPGSSRQFDNFLLMEPNFTNDAAKKIVLPIEQWFPCSLNGCAKRFPSLECLKVHHIASHKKIQYISWEKWNNSILHSNFNEDKKIEMVNENYYKCNECEYVFKHKRYLQRHKKEMHLKIKGYSCNLCEYSCCQKGNLKRHIELVHNTKDQHCDKCGYSTNVTRKMRSHKQLIHQSIEVYKCQWCKYSTTKKENLKRHEKIVHLKIKDKKCDQCPYATFDLFTLNAHIKIQHQRCKEHKCPLCEYACGTKGRLNEHNKLCHERILDKNCDECSYTTSKNCLLKRHKERAHGKS